MRARAKGLNYKLKAKKKPSEMEGCEISFFYDLFHLQVYLITLLMQ
jgi:hypothetical protein